MPDTTQSWMWWIFSTVFLALLVNLTSSYTKPYIDKGLGRFSKRREIKSKKKQEEYERKLRLLFGNPNRFISLQTKIILAMFGVVIFLLLNIIMIFTAYYTEKDPFTDSVKSVLGELGFNVFTGVVMFVSWVFVLDILNRFKEFANLSRDFIKLTDSKHGSNTSAGDNETKPEERDNN